LRLKKIKFRWIYLLALIGLGLLAAVPQIPWLANPYYLDIAIKIGIFTMVTVGLCLLTGYTGQISLGQAAFYGVGGYTSAILSKTYGFPPWGAMAIAAVGTGIFAYLIGLPVLRLKGNYLAMATLALGIIMYIVFREAAGFTGGPDGIAAVPKLAIGGFVFNTAEKYYYLVWIFCVAILLISQNIVNSRTGRAMRAIRDNEAAAESVGINVLQLKAKIFALSAVYASLAGSLLVHYWSYVGPQPFSFMSSIRVLVMAVVGGLASVWGSIFGTGVVEVLTDRLRGFGDYNIIAFGLMLMIVIIFMPRGVWVHAREWLAQLRRKLSKRAEV